MLGTPAYMAPEQAIGAVDQVDERSDVFGLGAILAVILTGRPPFVGDTAESTRVLAARGKLDECFARLDACGAEPELVGALQAVPEPGARRPAGRRRRGGVGGGRAAGRRPRSGPARPSSTGCGPRGSEPGPRPRRGRSGRSGGRNSPWRPGCSGSWSSAAAAWLAVRGQAEARRADADRVASVALGRAEQLASQAGAIDAARWPPADEAVRLWEQAEAAVAAGRGGAGRGGRRGLVGAGAGQARPRSRRPGAVPVATPPCWPRWRPPAAGTGVRAGRMLTTGRRSGSTERRSRRPACRPTATRRPWRPPSAPSGRVCGRPWCGPWTAGSTASNYPPDPDADRVRATADLVDPDPIRKEIRAAVAAGDQQALARLAERLAAADLDPATAVALGYGLYDRGIAADAVRILRTARDRHPSDPSAAVFSTYALMAQSPSDPVVVEEAVGCGRAEVAAHPERAAGHYHLGQAYDTGKNDPAAAEPHYLKALELNPRFTFAMINLGANREGRATWPGPSVGTARPPRPTRSSRSAHDNLGWLHELRGDLAGAEAEYRKSIELNPEGELSRKRLAVVRLLPRLDDVIAGRAAPATPAETIDFAQLCIRPFRRQYAAAARLLERAFADDPKLAAAERYNAACYAAMAGCGEGADPPADPAERATLRGKALGWLRTDLALRAKQAESDKPADREPARGLSWWLEDSDLAGVRPARAALTCRPKSGRAGTPSGPTSVRRATAPASPPPTGRRPRSPGRPPVRAAGFKASKESFPGRNWP